jgi:hypothetical protein
MQLPSIFSKMKVAMTMATLLIACASLVGCDSSSSSISTEGRVKVFCAPNNIAYWMIDYTDGGGLAVNEDGKPLSCQEAKGILAASKALHQGLDKKNEP